MEISYGWNPPVVTFEALNNVVSEGDKLMLKPLVNERLRRYDTDMVSMSTSFFVGSADDWLHWKGDHFEGTVPPHIAAAAGAERCDAYTVPLDLTATVIHHFPRDIRYEQAIRCSLPLTVKRHPDSCGEDAELLTSPRIPRPATSVLVAAKKEAVSLTRDRCKLVDVLPLIPQTPVRQDSTPRSRVAERLIFETLLGEIFGASDILASGQSEEKGYSAERHEALTTTRCDTPDQMPPALSGLDIRQLGDRRKSTPPALKAWQQEIQENYAEFEAAKNNHNTFVEDVSMLDEASEDELLGLM